MTRVAVLRDPDVSSGTGQLGAIQSVAPSFGVELRPLNMRDASEIERAVTAFAQSSNGGLIVTGSALATVHRDLIIALAARHRLPAVYAVRFFVAGGGLISYGPDSIDPYRRAASYVDRILKGEKPADLPVQVPTKYELLINLKTAKALGLDVPPTLLARADEVIECEPRFPSRAAGGLRFSRSKRPTASSWRKSRSPVPIVIAAVIAAAELLVEQRLYPGRTRPLRSVQGAC